MSVFIIQKLLTVWYHNVQNQVKTM